MTPKPANTGAAGAASFFSVLEVALEGIPQSKPGARAAVPFTGVSALVSSLVGPLVPAGIEGGSLPTPSAVDSSDVFCSSTVGTPPNPANNDAESSAFNGGAKDTGAELTGFADAEALRENGKAGGAEDVPNENGRVAGADEALGVGQADCCADFSVVVGAFLGGGLPKRMVEKVVLEEVQLF